MAVYTTNPLQDERWKAFVGAHPRSSIFHTRGWLEALHRTYAYEPVAFTTCSPTTELTNAIVFCEVRSWATGRRLVSLPFSDHCDPLVAHDEQQTELLSEILSYRARPNQQGYVEIRPRSQSSLAPFAAERKFCFHVLDLQPSHEKLFRGFHHDSVQRKIKRAVREGLRCECENSPRLLDLFYELLLKTRRRQGVPPQPRQWFRNLAACLGDRMAISVVWKGASAVASVITLRHRDTVVYKYGCSDAPFHPLGGVHFAFWNTIQRAKEDGFREFDLGRSDPANGGLVTFKDRWGTTRSTLTYFRYPSSSVHKEHSRWQALFRHMPNRILTAAGALLYKHIG